MAALSSIGSRLWSTSLLLSCGGMWGSAQEKQLPDSNTASDNRSENGFIGGCLQYPLHGMAPAMALHPIRLAYQRSHQTLHRSNTCKPRPPIGLASESLDQSVVKMCYTPTHVVSQRSDFKGASIHPTASTLRLTTVPLTACGSGGRSSSRLRRRNISLTYAAPVLTTPFIQSKEMC